MTGVLMSVTKVCGGSGSGGGLCIDEFMNKEVVVEKEEDEKRRRHQMSILELLLTVLRKTVAYCRRWTRRNDEDGERGLEIGLPTNVRHVAHVTFDRFEGFLGLPVEFEDDVVNKAPSASANVFGVSAESMQCSYDPKGYSVPTILLLMQKQLYTQGGLKAEGIFRINPENSKENHVRDKLNRGIVPNDIDVHCLAGLIKAWFRELPEGVLDRLSPDQVLDCNSEEESMKLVKQLQPTESALLRWAIDLMADVVEQEEFNKMNARNIAMVFAPNMTQMSDPLTALLHAVQVMNFLKTLILVKLREREHLTTGIYTPMSSHCFGRDSHREDELQHGWKINGASKENQSAICCCSEHKDVTELTSSSEADDISLRQQTEKMTISRVLEEEPEVYYTKIGHNNTRSRYSISAQQQISKAGSTTYSSSIMSGKDSASCLINPRRKKSPSVSKDHQISNNFTHC